MLLGWGMSRMLKWTLCLNFLHLCKTMQKKWAKVTFPRVFVHSGIKQTDGTRVDILNCTCKCFSLHLALAGRVHALVNWVIPAHARVCVLQVFWIQRQAVLRTPSLPIPLQVHMCFISRPAHWTVNSSGGLAWGICAARGWERAIAGNKRQAPKESPCSDSVSCRPLKPPASFSSIRTPPPSLTVPLDTCVSLRVPFGKLVYSTSNSASTHCCACKFLFFLLPFCLCQSGFLIMSGLLQQPCPPPPQPLCPLIPVVQAILALFLFMFVCCDTASEKEPQHFHHSKHLRRRETMVSVCFATKLLTLLLHSKTRTHTHTHSLIYSPQPGTYH